MRMMTLMLLLIPLFSVNIVDVLFKFRYERKTVTFNPSSVTFLLPLTSNSIINNVVRALSFQKKAMLNYRKSNKFCCGSCRKASTERREVEKNIIREEQRVIKINYTIKERMLKCGYASFITVVYEI